MRFFPHCPIHTGYLRLASANVMLMDIDDSGLGTYQI